MANKKRSVPTGGSTNQSGATRRDRLRAQQEAEAAKARRIRVIWVVLAVLVITALVAVIAILVAKSQSDNTFRPPHADKNLSKPDYEVGAGLHFASANAKSDALRVDFLYDYQCPGCAQAELRQGDNLSALEQSGDIVVNYDTMTFMDRNLNNDKSTKAAIGAMCADTVGKFEEMHKTIFAGQPEREIDGFTEEQVSRTFAEDAGITGADFDTWSQCYTTQQTLDYVEEISGYNQASGLVQTTPTILVNGKKVDMSSGVWSQPNTPDELLAVLKNVAGV
jgi:protein-disulfide isomerase